MMFHKCYCALTINDSSHIGFLKLNQQYHLLSLPIRSSLCRAFNPSRFSSSLR